MKRPIRSRTGWWLVMLATVLGTGACVRAEDNTQPTFRTYAGAFLVGQNHDFFVESELRLPLVLEGPWGVYYQHRESTPFLDIPGQVQASLWYVREDFEVSFRLNDQLRLIAVGGYDSAQQEDRSGQFNAFAVGGGIGAPLRTDGERLYWQVLAGGYVGRQKLAADWWSDTQATFRLVDFAQAEYLGSPFHASVALAGQAQTANEGDRIHGLYRVGPQLQFLTAHGNRSEISLQWYRQDHNPFYGFDENGLLLGMNVVSSRDEKYQTDFRADRPSGWFPMIWGSYDVAVGTAQRTSKFAMNVDVVDFVVADHRYTFALWYENHQESRFNDFDNVSYSVTLGLDTPVGLESWLSHGEPLVAGLDFFHRSDHTLDPDPARVARFGQPSSVGLLIPNGSINLLPLVSLRTLGWDLPYRDPASYERQTAWLNRVDWRVEAGYAWHSNRYRAPLSGQLGVNWDVATLQGCVVYLTGIGSIGNASPDWLGEAGLRRPLGKVFVRYEDYGINQKLAHDNLLVLGVGVNL